MFAGAEAGAAGTASSQAVLPAISARASGTSLASHLQLAVAWGLHLLPSLPTSSLASWPVLPFSKASPSFHCSVQAQLGQPASSPFSQTRLHFVGPSHSGSGD